MLAQLRRNFRQLHSLQPLWQRQSAAFYAQGFRHRPPPLPQGEGEQDTFYHPFRIFSGMLQGVFFALLVAGLGATGVFGLTYVVAYQRTLIPREGWTQQPRQQPYQQQNQQLQQDSGTSDGQ